MLVPGFQLSPSIKLLRPLRSGGMGDVWVAENTNLGAQVAVKFLSGNSLDGQALGRFHREAATASQIKSPHVVQIFDHGVLPGGAPYIVMELLEGRELTERLDEGAMTPHEVAELLGQVAKALQKAHDKGIIHRDLKPDNLFLCSEGDDLFCKILDFGIAKGGDAKAACASTVPGTLLGTPHYMSPEQAVGSENLDHRSDLWSLGVVVYEALTLRRPFDGNNVGLLLAAITSNEPPPSPSSVNPSLSPEIDRWFATACARDPARRFASARDMADAFWAAIGEPRSAAGSLPVSVVAPSSPRDTAPVDHLASTLQAPAQDDAPAEVELDEVPGIPDRITLDRRPVPRKIAQRAAQSSPPAALVVEEEAPEGRGKLWLAVGAGLLFLLGVGMVLRSLP